MQDDAVGEIRILADDGQSQCQIDPPVFGRYGIAKADAQTTLPAKVPANIKNIKLLRGAYHGL